MTPVNIQVGGVTAVKARLFMQWRGQWTLDVDLDPAQPATSADVPSGQVTTTIGDNVTLVGTVDPRLSGRFVAAVKAHIIAGGAGWDRHVPAQDFQSTGGVSALAVENATAQIVGETINDPQPVSLGLRWERMADAASTIFTNPDRDWYVDPSGITQVGAWPAATPDPSVEVLSFDPSRQTATISATALVLPGTVLTDSADPPRWDGGLTVRDIETTWDASGMRATCWFGQSPAPRIAGMLKSMVQAFAHVDSLKRWVYTVVSLGTGTTLNLQATQNPNGTSSRAPNLANCPVMPSTAGLSCKPKLGSRCHVVFLSDGWSDPMVTSFDTTLPDSATYDTTGRLALGPSAAGVDLCGGGPGVAGQGDTVLSYLPPTVPFSAMILPSTPIVGTMTIPGPLIGTIQTASSTVTRASMIAWPFLLYFVYRSAGPFLFVELLAAGLLLVLIDHLRRRRWAR